MKIYFDMDGVLADFDRGVEELAGFYRQDQDCTSKEQDDAMWEAIKNVPHFYDKLDPMPGALEMFRQIREEYGNVCEILTGIPKPHRGIETAGEDKTAWVRRYLGSDVPVHIVYREEKKTYVEGKYSILIDDLEGNIKAWEFCGGTGILHKSVKDTCKEVRKKEYETRKCYKDSIDIIKRFIEDELQGNIENLKDFDFTQIGNSDYIGEINDPDMYLITQAIYIVLWGYLFELSFDNLGSWGQTADKQYPFRGDTMNSFNSIYGKDGLIANRYNISNELKNNMRVYQKIYHSVGNFIVIPNRNNVNGKRANYYTIQDYYDSFLGVIYQYQNTTANTEFSIFFDELLPVLNANIEYQNIKFKEWIDVFFLEPYIKNDKPYNVFNIDMSMRKKEYIGRKKRSEDDYFSKTEYEELVQKYFTMSKEIIAYRTNRILDKLKELL